MILEVETQEEFEELVANNERVVVDFWATWCGPCRQFKPHFELAASKTDETFVTVDVDKAPWSMVEYGVMAVPTVLLIENEKVTNLQSRTAPKLLAELS